jgi:peptidoglycan/LPS O-acetylase OafA/YrhL
MKGRDEILDLIRGLSALMVLAAHIRGFVFCDLGELANPNLLTKAFYFLTGIHHQAVMVFFVLSGYFVGGGVLNALKKDRFSWSHYALARLSRLWVVLLPALILTALCDQLGSHFAPEAYAGKFRNLWMSGPEPAQAANFDTTAFFGNLAFLQNISVPVFGSNGPLWSLANEFWYYVIFPLLAGGISLLKKSPVKCCAWLLLGGFITGWLPVNISSEGLIWLLGVVVWLIGNRLAGRLRVAWITGGFLLFAASLALSKTSSPFGSDYAVGIAFSIWMVALLGVWRHLNFLRPLGRYLSEISYTLYVVHFPILFLFAATVLRGKQFTPGAYGYGLFGILFAGSIGLATVLYWLFEKRTDRVRLFVSKLIFR